MDDFEQGLRGMLEARAESLHAAAAAPADLARRVRRRRAWHIGVPTALAIVVLAGSSRLLLSDSAETHVATQTSSTTTPSGAPVEMFVDGRMVKFSSTPGDLATLPINNAPTTPPVRTRYGVLAALGATGRSEAWLAREGGEAVRIAASVSGLGVAADGATLAWSENTWSGTAYTSLLVLARLPDGRPVHSTSVEGAATVRGFVGDLVLLVRADGAGTRASIWVPSTGQVVDVPGFGTVELTDPSRSIAVLNEGDGLCATMFTVGPDASVRHDPPMRPCRRGLALSPNGALLATASTLDRGEELAIVTTDGQEQSRANLRDRILQAVWRNDSDLMVLTAGVPAGATYVYTVWLCRSGGGCDRAWDVPSRAGPDSLGSVWIIGP